MGSCSSSSVAAAEQGVSADQERVSKAIDRSLRDDEQRAQQQVKILLLGPGSSGKSTVLKQMKIVHLDGFTPHEIEEYRLQIFRNVCEAMRDVLDLMDSIGMSLESSTIEQCGPFIAAALYPMRDLSENEPYPRMYLDHLRTLWADENLQSALSKRHALAMPENMEYYYAHLDRLFTPGYRPTNQDILRARHKTTGITETQFQANRQLFRVFDVGGQRSERRKWIHCFENVTAILFMVALSGYDQCLIEDRESNQMQEALMLFDSICNSRWFIKNTAMILFLNKLDLFKERILLSPIRDYFPEYEGDESDFCASKSFFRDKFVALNRTSKRIVYTHFTTALDTNGMRVVMSTVYDNILSRNLATLAL